MVSVKNPEIRDRVQGILLGLAAGDRIGGPIRMALCLATSLAERGAFDREHILERYLAWWRGGGFDTGPVAAQVFRSIDSGVPGGEAVDRAHAESLGRTAGCNPAHRSPPLAMAAFLADTRLAELAQQEASLTHRDPIAGEAAAAAVTLCRLLVKGTDWPSALQLTGQASSGRIREAVLGGKAARLSNGGFAPDVLRSAIYFVTENASFPGALEASLAFAGPANYCPVLVGALAGARWGATSIPARHLETCDLLPQVRSVAGKLADSWRREFAQ